MLPNSTGKQILGVACAGHFHVSETARESSGDRY
jgi:hypothetical protein